MKKFLFLIILTSTLFACKKEELITVENNDSPDDLTVGTTTIERYINRAYIRTLGREPDSVEFNLAKTDLIATNADSSSRVVFANSLFTKAEYLPHLYDLLKIDYLNNIDTSEYTNWITLFEIFSQDSTYITQWAALEYELDRLYLLRDAFAEFTSQQIDIKELQRRMCNNYFYDQINMGSANFVIFTFKHLIARNPTASEESYGISMVEGNNSSVFLQSGNSKNDFLAILTSTSSYYEGQVIQLYKLLLDRTPSTYEMSSGTQLFQSTDDFTAVQKKIISSNEFIGL